MQSRFSLTVGLLLAALLLLAASEAAAQNTDKQKAERKTTELFSFAPGGTIYLKDSFGEVRVAGWDKPEVEVTISKATRKEYHGFDQNKADAELDGVKIEVVKSSETSLLITTAFPTRGWSRLFKGKTNAEVYYDIKVPQRSTLVIKHDIGAVNVANISGDIEVTSRIGEISLALPEHESYAMDARARIGDVQSEFENDSRRQKLLGAVAESAHPAQAHLLFLRVGIGAIEVSKLRAEQRQNENGR